MKTRWLVGSLLGVAVFGCGGNDENTGRATLTLGIGLTDGSENVAARRTLADGEGSEGFRGVDAASNTLVVTSAIAYVRDIELYLPEGASCEGSPSGDDDSSSDDDDASPSEDHGSDDDDDSSLDDDDSSLDDDDKEAERSAESSAHCEDDKIVIEGPWVFDLVAGTSTPPLEEISVPTGTYRRIDVRFDHAGDESFVASTLADRTLVAEGTVVGAAANGFTLSLRFVEDARFEDDDGIRLEAGAARDVQLALDVSRWFQRINLDECVVDADIVPTDGVFELSEDGDCSDVENDLKEAIKTSTWIH